MTENSSAVGNASHRRELSKIASKNGADFGQLGNAAKLREALLALDAWAKIVINNPKDMTAIECAEFVEETIKTALALPPRNCDVGSAEEQAQRYLKLKKEYIERVTYCPAQGPSYFPESLWWAQMPYEEGGKK